MHTCMSNRVQFAQILAKKMPETEINPKLKTFYKQRPWSTLRVAVTRLVLLCIIVREQSATFFCEQEAECICP